MKQNNKEAISLLKVLAQGSTDKSRALLKAHGKGDAMNYTDLEAKLADLYRSAPDKIEIEKEFVAIHPHTEFILKYNKPQPPIIEAGLPLDGKKEEEKASCEGTSCNCHKSSADGKNQVEVQKVTVPHNNENVIIAAIAIVAVFGLFLHYSKR